ncbi:MAG TPA: Cof-type HAD-IIB family hydrolase [Ktedonobacteraceae bacterium]|nr:Cof-type HAD-IIB family hydrolase [Ktedonobacteraceae bacterium]
MSNARRARLLVLDVDGTLLTTDYQITMATCRAVQHVASQGVQVILASARSPGALRLIMGELGITGLAISYTGALTCRLYPDSDIPTEVVAEQRMNLSSAHIVLRSALEQEISVGWYIGDDWYVPRLDAALRLEGELTGVMPTVVPDLAHFTESPHKLLCLAGDPALLPRLSLLANTLPQDCTGQFSYVNYLEITHQGVDKASALLALGQQLGIATAEMVAIGDAENDITMLRLVGFGIAMGNASPEVQAAADWVTDTNNQDGVATAIARLQATGWI